MFRKVLAEKFTGQILSSRFCVLLDLFSNAKFRIQWYFRINLMDERHTRFPVIETQDWNSFKDSIDSGGWESVFGKFSMHIAGAGGTGTVTRRLPDSSTPAIVASISHYYCALRSILLYGNCNLRHY